jgi:hypothetical protein
MNKKTVFGFVTLSIVILLTLPSLWAKTKSDLPDTSEAKTKSDLPDTSETKSKGTVKCTMDFELHSWSAFYKSGKGTGTISCSNGQKSKIKIRSHGGGITFGKFNIANGKGKFSPVHNISELYGKYANVGGEGAAGKARMAASLSKDDIDLDIEGKGTGGGFGFDFSGFRISPVK